MVLFAVVAGTMGEVGIAAFVARVVGSLDTARVTDVFDADMVDVEKMSVALSVGETMAVSEKGADVLKTGTPLLLLAVLLPEPEPNMPFWAPSLKPQHGLYAGETPEGGSTLLPSFSDRKYLCQWRLWVGVG